YRSEPLASPVEVLGELTASVSVSTSAADADVTVALIDIAPDGYAQLITESIRRLSHRDPANAPLPAEPGVVYTAVVDLGAAGYRFAPGHRIGIEVSGSAFDRWDRNLHPGHTAIHEPARRRRAPCLPVRHHVQQLRLHPRQRLVLAHRARRDHHLRHRHGRHRQMGAQIPLLPAPARHQRVSEETGRERLARPCGSSGTAKFSG